MLPFPAHADLQGFSFFFVVRIMAKCLTNIFAAMWERFGRRDSLETSVIVDGRKDSPDITV